MSQSRNSKKATSKTITLRLDEVVLEGEEHRVGLTAQRGTEAERVLRNAVRLHVVEGVSRA